MSHKKFKTMLTKEFFERANALPQSAKAQLTDFLQFLEAKYGGRIQPMSNQEFEEFLKKRLSQVGDRSKTGDAFEAIEVIRAELRPAQTLANASA